MIRLVFAKVSLLIALIALLPMLIIDYSVISIPALPKNPYFKTVSADVHELLKTGKSHNIAIILSDGNTDEQETAQRFCIAAQKLKWRCYVYHYNWYNLLTSTSTAKFHKIVWKVFAKLANIDFIIQIYPSGRRISPIGRIRTYLLLSKDMSAVLSNIAASSELGEALEIAKEKTSRESYKSYLWNNIGDYDGYIYSGYRYGWLNNFNLADYSNIFRVGRAQKSIIEGYPSIYDTNFTPITFKGLFYFNDSTSKLYSNKKYHNVMLEVEKKGHLNVFGPQNHWADLHNAYKGTIPPDGFSMLQKMQELGISLVLHDKSDLHDGIPSTQIFEAAAASNVIISDKNRFVLDEFGKCVLYIDINKPADDIAAQIDQHMYWIMQYPNEAREKARCVHTIFHQRFTLELLLDEIANNMQER